MTLSSTTAATQQTFPYPHTVTTTDMEKTNMCHIQRVVIEDAVSVDQELGFGVAQGSVLGLKIQCMYTKPVSDIMQRHGLSHQSYADDTQLYMTMDHSNNNWHDGLARIQLCVSEIKEWMDQKILKLNDDKTELTL